MKLTGENANPNCIPKALESSSWYHNYYLPGCPQGAVNVSGYHRLLYADVYPGVDMHVYSNKWGYKLYFVVKPGADPDDILLQFNGQDSLGLDPIGSLCAYVGGTYFKFPNGIAYQDVNGSTVAVPWWLTYQEISPDQLVNFGLGAYDPTKPLIIDISESLGMVGGGGEQGVAELEALYPNGGPSMEVVITSSATRLLL